MLQLAEKRDVQSATTAAKRQRQRRRPRRGDDEIMEIAKVAEQQHQLDREDGRGEQIVLKGTGRAIQKVLELGLWFQQREDEYVVRLKTGSVAAVDDIEVTEGAAEGEEVIDGMDDVQQHEMNSEGNAVHEEGIPETQIRYTSSLEVSVRRR